MAIRRLVASDMGMAQTQASLNRPYRIFLSGTGNLSYTIPHEARYMFCITDIVLSGTGTFSITEDGETILSVDVEKSFTLSPKISLNVDLSKPVVITFTGSGNLKANLFGYYIRK